MLCFFKRHSLPNNMKSTCEYWKHVVFKTLMVHIIQLQESIFAILDKSSSTIDLHQDSQRKRTTGSPQKQLPHRWIWWSLLKLWLQWTTWQYRRSETWYTCNQNWISSEKKHREKSHSYINTYRSSTDPMVQKNARFFIVLFSTQPTQAVEPPPAKLKNGGTLKKDHFKGGRRWCLTYSKSLGDMLAFGAVTKTMFTTTSN